MSGEQAKARLAARLSEMRLRERAWAQYFNVIQVAVVKALLSGIEGCAIIGTQIET